MSSGSARGWSHIGVIRALLERGIRPDVVTGASVGALVAGACAAGTLGPLEAWVCTLTQRDVWRLVDTTFRGGGVMTGNRLMAAVAQCVTDPPIESLPVSFGFRDRFRLLAVSGGAPAPLFGEWDGESLRPLTVWGEAGAVSLV